MAWTGCNPSYQNPAPAPRAERSRPQPSPAESPALSEAGQALQALVTGGLEEQVAVAYMRRHHPEYDPSVEEILALNERGVPGDWLAKLIAPASEPQAVPAPKMEIPEVEETPSTPATPEPVMTMADPVSEPTPASAQLLQSADMAQGTMPSAPATEPVMTQPEVVPALPEGSTTTTTTTTTLTTSQGQQVIIQETQPPATVVVQAPAPVIQTSTSPLVIQPPLASYPSQVQVFYQDLAPYGEWVHIDPYGWCWQPTVVRADIQWRPYVDQGQWVWTDCGWYWQSNYSWGWAPFHYGRWAQHAHRRWVWIPDTTWGPSWVSWRQSDTYCGWAPLPPAARCSPSTGFTYLGSRVGFSFDFGLNVNHYVFLPIHRFTAPSCRPYLVGSDRVLAVYHHSKVSNHYRFDLTGGRIFNQGLDPHSVEFHGKTRLSPRQVLDGKRAEDTLRPVAGKIYRHIPEGLRNGNRPSTRPQPDNSPVSTPSRPTPGTAAALASAAPTATSRNLSTASRYSPAPEPSPQVSNSRPPVTTARPLADTTSRSATTSNSRGGFTILSRSQLGADTTSLARTSPSESSFRPTPGTSRSSLSPLTRTSIRDEAAERAQARRSGNSGPTITIIPYGSWEDRAQRETSQITTQPGIGYTSRPSPEPSRRSYNTSDPTVRSLTPPQPVTSIPTYPVYRSEPLRPPQPVTPPQPQTQVRSLPMRPGYTVGSQPSPSPDRGGMGIRESRSMNAPGSLPDRSSFQPQREAPGGITRPQPGLERRR